MRASATGPKWPKAASLNKRAIGTLVGAVAVFAIFHPHWIHPTRYGQLKCVINHHTGFAHMTRGMNMNTINALRQASEPQDISVLVRMLDDRDHVTQMTAAQTLARMNESGLRALRQELANMDRQTGSNFYRYQAVQEAITDSGDEASVAYVKAISAAK